MKVYITVCRDRHVDDEINVHKTLSKARRHLKDWVASYETRYKWTEDKYENVGSDWIYAIETDSEDGPYAHIEASQLL